jgi:oligopeptide transport system permease protein
VTRFILRRLVSAVMVLWAIMTLSFFMMRWAPGGPFDAEKKLPPAVEANLYATYGMARPVVAETAGVVSSVVVSRGGEVEEGGVVLALEGGGVVTAPEGGELLGVLVRPGDAVEPGQTVAWRKTSLLTQYLTAMGSYLQGDFGVSLATEGQRTVAELIGMSFPISLELGLYSMAFAILLGVTLGLLAGLRPNSLMDYTLMSLGMVGISMSAIVLGPLLIIVFGVNLGWVDYRGWAGIETKILPTMTLGLIYAAYFARLTRGGMLEIVRQDFIRTARAKGLSDRVIVMRHALKGAVLPSVTFLGPGLAGIMTGSVVVERIFEIPGVSEYFVSGAINRDYPMVMGVVVLYSTLLVFMNLAVDIAYTLLDPRVSYERG